MAIHEREPLAEDEFNWAEVYRQNPAQRRELGRGLGRSLADETEMFLAAIAHLDE